MSGGRIAFGLGFELALERLDRNGDMLFGVCRSLERGQTMIVKSDLWLVRVYTLVTVKESSVTWRGLLEGPLCVSLEIESGDKSVVLARWDRAGVPVGVSNGFFSQQPKYRDNAHSKSSRTTHIADRHGGRHYGRCMRPSVSKRTGRAFRDTQVAMANDSQALISFWRPPFVVKSVGDLYLGCCPSQERVTHGRRYEPPLCNTETMRALGGSEKGK